MLEMTAPVKGRRPRVLIVTYGFPPAQAIGHIRVGKLAKYLLRLGWDVRVVTSHPDSLPFPPLLDVEIPEELIVRVRFGSGGYSTGRAHDAPVTTSARLMRSLKQFVRRAMPGLPRKNYSRLPDLASPWYSGAERAGDEVIRAWQPDVMFSTSGPAGAHIVASRLAIRHALPWVADYRDLWTDNPIFAYPFWVEWLEKRYERRVLRTAAHLVTVSIEIADRLRALHAKPVSIVYNGYDPDDYGETYEKAVPFVMTYTGNATAETRDPGPLLAAVALLRDRYEITPERLRIQFIGNTKADYIHGLTARTATGPYVDVIGVLPYRESVARQQGSAALLMLNHPAPDSPGMLSGKLLEYLGAGRPILAVGPRDPAVSRVLEETAAGEWSDTPEGLAEILLRWITAWEAGALEVCVPAGQLASYSRAVQARQISDIMRSVLDRSAMPVEAAS